VFTCYGQEFFFGHAKIEEPVRYQGADVDTKVEYSSLVLRREAVPL
jgi:hypothetical protein